MHETEFAILSLFKKESNRDFSTSEIVELTFPDDWKNVEYAFTNYIHDSAQILKAKRLKAQLHRRVLYYLAKLVKEEILKVTKEGSKGEKFYSLCLGENEEFIIEKHKRKIVISKPSMPAMPIEGYEQKGIIKKFEESTWIERLNSVLIECSLYSSMKELSSDIDSFFSNINDCIALNNFELLLDFCDDFSEFFKELINECEVYGKRICLIIDCSNIDKKNSKKLLSILELYLSLETKDIKLIFDIEIKELQSNRSFFRDVIELFSNASRKMYFKNNDLIDTPCFIGKAGPYTFNSEEYSHFKSRFGTSIKNIVCSQSSIIVDVQSFFENYNGASAFRSFIMNITKSFLSANVVQRRGSDDYFKELVNANSGFERDIFSLSRNFIRFWNYGWKQKDMDQEFMVDLFESAKSEVDQFCNAEETIYLACGIPTRFKVAFSSAAKEAIGDGLSDPNYGKLIISKMEEFHDEDYINSIKPKEKLFKIFDGGDIIIFHRTGLVKPELVLRELNVLLSTFELPFFAYDLGESHQGDTKLTHFFK